MLSCSNVSILGWNSCCHCPIFSKSGSWKLLNLLCRLKRLGQWQWNVPCFGTHHFHSFSHIFLYSFSHLYIYYIYIFSPFKFPTGDKNPQRPTFGGFMTPNKNHGQVRLGIVIGKGVGTKQGCHEWVLTEKNWENWETRDFLCGFFKIFLGRKKYIIHILSTN